MITVNSTIKHIAATIFATIILGVFAIAMLVGFHTTAINGHQAEHVQDNEIHLATMGVWGGRDKAELARVGGWGGRDKAELAMIPVWGPGDSRAVVGVSCDKAELARVGVWGPGDSRAVVGVSCDEAELAVRVWGGRDGEADLAAVTFPAGVWGGRMV